MPVMDTSYSLCNAENEAQELKVSSTKQKDHKRQSTDLKLLFVNF